MTKSILGLIVALLAVAPARASGPKADDMHGDRVVAVTNDGTAWTEAMIDSVFARGPDSLRKAFKQIGLVWHGNDRYLSFEDLAAYCGPVVWFSPDEPLLDGATGKQVTMPTWFPFEEPAAGPVVYYRVRAILENPDFKEEDRPTLMDVDADRRTTRIDLYQTWGIDLDYFFFYPSEEGLGAHKYDVESVQMKLMVVKAPRYPELGYWITVQQVTGKAHGNLWYDNNLEVDRQTRFPIHILVEEGKHASCTDQNADGIYTPGYDVNQRVNDAWGVRDVMATGTLYTGGFQAWMSKPRQPGEQVFPPLPEDSLHRAPYVKDGVYAPDNAIYELRPFPRLAPALAYDPELKRFVDKGDENWPEVEELTSAKKISRWVDTEAFAKSLSIAYRYDGDPGLSFAFPLLVVKNVADPLAGGWFVNRVYLKDVHLRDFSWNLMYTSSASRWLDGYFTFGWEWDNDGTSTRTHTMTEVGVKLRFNVEESPVGFLAKLTDFWGVRVGVKNLGIWDFERMGYAVEVGAGTF